MTMPAETKTLKALDPLQYAEQPAAVSLMNEGLARRLSNDEKESTLLDAKLDAIAPRVGAQAVS